MVKMLWLQEEGGVNVPKFKTNLVKVELSGTCLLLDDWFIFVAAALLFLFPCCRILQASAKLWTLTHLRSGNTSRISLTPRLSQGQRQGHRLVAAEPLT